MILNNFLQDLVVVCGSGPAVRTSAVLLAAISPWLRRLMEEAGEDFCLVLPSISTDIFTEYLSTCITHASMDAEESVTHQLIQQTFNSKNVKKYSIKPEVKLEAREEVDNVFSEKIDNKVAGLKSKQSQQLNSQGGDFEDLDQSINFSDENQEEGEVTPQNRKRKRAIKSLPRHPVSSSKKVLLQKRKHKNPAIKSEEVVEDMDDNIVKDEVESDREDQPEDLENGGGSEPGDLDSDSIKDVKKVKKSKTDKKKKKKVGQNIIEKSAQELLCTLCGEKFIHGSRGRAHNRYRYERHMLKHQVENFTCDCPNAPKIIQKYDVQRLGKDFYEKERHMKVEHMGWIACQQCSLCFETEELMNKHIENHKNSVVCHLCGFEAPDKKVMLNHMKCHTDTMPEQCPTCGKTVSGKASLVSHMKAVHDPATCTICGAVVKRIKIHMEQVHMEDSDKRFICSYCGKGFMEKYQHNKHVINMHTKTQPYQCRYGCDNRYNDASNRNAHEKRRHGSSFDGGRRPGRKGKAPSEML